MYAADRVSEENLKDLFMVTFAQLQYIQDEYTAVNIKGDFGKGVASLWKNTQSEHFRLPTRSNLDHSVCNFFGCRQGSVSVSTKCPTWFQFKQVSIPTWGTQPRWSLECPILWSGSIFSVCWSAVSKGATARTRKLSTEFYGISASVPFTGR